jgi:15-hydroxyprostaglandin dehydrogenase (NAD)
MSGETVELSLENIYFRKCVDWANDSQEWIGTASQTIWNEAYSKVPEKTGYA